MALVINSDSRHFFLSLKVLFLLMFPELSEPHSAVVIYRFFFFTPKIFFVSSSQANFTYFSLCQLEYTVLISAGNVDSGIISA